MPATGTGADGLYNCHLARLQAEFAAASTRLEPDHSVAVDLQYLEYLPLAGPEAGPVFGRQFIDAGGDRDDSDLRAHHDCVARLVHGRKWKSRRELPFGRPTSSH